MKLYSSNRSLTLGHPVVSVWLLALVLICTSILLISQSIGSRVYKIDNVYASKNFDFMSLVHERPVNRSQRKCCPGCEEITKCDLYHGKWVYNSTGPLYSNNSCPVLSQMQNCQGNGRPDKEYENWRWTPTHCDVPRFDATKFLELMRGKTIAYIGDSVAWNQMESLLCILWQVEVPQNRGSRRMQRYIFRTTSTKKIIRIWSWCLVHKTSDPFEYAPKGLTSFTSTFLVKINNTEAYGISVETILTSLATHPNYTELRLMDVTQAFGYRSDGHPGPYRSPDPFKITERGSSGRPPPQDCLHWCMPGPIDTWNELMFEEIRKEFEGAKEVS
ncbi:hypothetical protein DCAR_0626215 [Daucus carota subsp. sativus]|uniref:Trichome birefringence-like N-terminal domain-containing protein n=1 Tax=Daucus carota subsp. sativus TaxID=79200 RepID=A0AAF1B7K4_DAUCS|nr:hypothetical protein DCAR_0626215 [Daucus carota subsp. sativus]